jgi:hypothetical protein
MTEVDRLSVVSRIGEALDRLGVAWFLGGSLASSLQPALFAGGTCPNLLIARKSRECPAAPAVHPANRREWHG